MRDIGRAPGSLPIACPGFQPAFNIIARPSGLCCAQHMLGAPNLSHPRPSLSSLASPAELNEYSFVLNVPDASLHSVLSLVMAYTASSGTDLSANLGWVLLPNIATTGGCTVADRYASYYIKQGRRGYTVSYDTAPMVSSSVSSSPSPSPSATAAGLLFRSLPRTDLLGALVGASFPSTASEAACRSACLASPGCDAYAFSSGALALMAANLGGQPGVTAPCFLLTNVTALVPNNMMASGVLSARYS